MNPGGAVGFNRLSGDVDNIYKFYILPSCPEKSIFWVGSSLDDVRSFAGEVQRGIYVLHAFQKKTRASSASDIDIARRRLEQLVGNTVVNKTRNKGRCLMKEKITRSSGRRFSGSCVPLLAKPQSLLKIIGLLDHFTSHNTIDAKGIRTSRGRKTTRRHSTSHQRPTKGRIHLFGNDSLLNARSRGSPRQIGSRVIKA